MSEIGASLLQLSGNHEDEINSLTPENIAIGYKTYDFNKNNELIINNPPIFDKIKPECLILSLNNHSNLIFFQINFHSFLQELLQFSLESLAPF